MAEIVWRAAGGHTGGMLRVRPREGADAPRAGRVYAAWDALRDLLQAARCDVLVVVATDHFMTFGYDMLPVFAIGHGDRFESWGEFGSPHIERPGIAALGEAVHGRLVASGFDVVGVDGMRLDHSFSCPLQFLDYGHPLPILPVYVNCTVPPLPSFERCIAFGEALGEALRAQTVVRRVGLIGTGGLSHWVGLPRTGEMNEEFDLRFLATLESGEWAEIASWDSEWVNETAGNGAAEIRNWLVVAAGGAHGRALERLAYEPVAAWKTGIGIACEVAA